jgi:hypothetical protein
VKMLERQSVRATGKAHRAHKFESGWEVGVIKAFDKKGPHAGKFSVKYKDDPNWWTCAKLVIGDNQ